MPIRPDHGQSELAVQVVFVLELRIEGHQNLVVIPRVNAELNRSGIVDERSVDLHLALNRSEVAAAYGVLIRWILSVPGIGSKYDSVLTPADGLDHRIRREPTHADRLRRVFGSVHNRQRILPR